MPALPDVLKVCSDRLGSLILAVQDGQAVQEFTNPPAQSSALQRPTYPEAGPSGRLPSDGLVRRAGYFGK